MTDLSFVGNHLWQSTVCVAVAWVLTLALRKNRAAVRYSVWMAASLKFLIPFAWLAELGTRFEWHAAPARIPVAMAQIGQPFAASVGRAGVPTAFVGPPAFLDGLLPAALISIWLCGIVVGLVYCVRTHWRMRKTLRGAKALDLNLPIPVLAAPGRMEPGVYGIWRPALLLPQGIAERLTPEQLEAILAHELRHVHRRDNLTAAIHMLVETVFWFHPAVWWIRARLIEEREQACDEGVLRLGKEPQVYAESILKVCEFYLSAPVCAAGVTGGELKKRIEGIMEDRFGVRLGIGKRALLAAAGTLAVASPVAIGLFAQTPASKIEFEVVSVKPSPKLNGPSEAMAYVAGSKIDDAQAVLRYFSLASLVQMAFRLPEDQIVGPGWMDDARFDVAGKLPAGSSKDKVPEMLQAMLADRFKMTVHHEERVRPVYWLVPGKGPLALKEYTGAAEDRVACNGGPGPGYNCHGVTMERLAEFLTRFSRRGGRMAGPLSGMWPDRPVIDKTGLTKEYDFKFGAGYPGTDIRGGDAVPDPAAMVTASAALKALGLALEPSRQPFDYVIIDHIERAPTEN